jgi:membrane protein required for colicin V production
MNIFDIIIAALLILAFVRGIMKGLFAEIASLVAIILGVYVAINYSHYIVEFLDQTPIKWSHQANAIVGFSVTFLAVVILIIVAGKFLTKIADITALGLINKFLGGIFGTLKTGLILSVIFILFNRLNSTIPLIDKETLENSFLYNPIKKIAPTIFPSIIKDDKNGNTEIKIPGKFK